MVATSRKPAKGKAVTTRARSSTRTPAKPAQPAPPETLLIGENNWTISPDPKPGHGCGYVDHVNRVIYPCRRDPSPLHLMFLAGLAGQQDARHNQGNPYLRDALRIDGELNRLHVDLENLIGLMPEADQNDVDQRSAMKGIAETRTALLSMVQHFNSLPGVYTVDAYRKAERENEAAGITLKPITPGDGIEPGAIVQTDEGTVAEVIVRDGNALILEALGEDDNCHNGERFAYNRSQIEAVIKPARGGYKDPANL